MNARQILLTRLQGMEVQLAELKRDMDLHFPRGEGARISEEVYYSRNYPGGALQTMDQDLQRMTQRVREELPFHKEGLV